MPSMGGGLGTPDVGAIVRAQQPPPLVQFLQAAAQFPQMRMQEQQQKMQMQQMQQQQAQQGWTQLGQTLLANPHYATDPQVGAQARRYAQMLGLPDPVGADGTVDTSIWKKPYDISDPNVAKYTEYLNTLSPGPSKDAALQMLTRQYNIDATTAQSLAAAAPVVSSRDQASLLRANGNVMRDTSISQLNTDRIKNSDLLAKYRVGLITAQTSKAYADAQFALAKARDDSTRANATMINAQTHMRSAMMRGVGARTSVDQRMAATDFESAKREFARAKEQLAAAQGKYNEAHRAGVDGDDLNPLAEALAGAQSAALQAQEDMDAAATAFGRNPGYAHGTQSASGASGVSVQSVGSGGQAPFTVPPGWNAGRDAQGHWYIQRGSTKKYWQGP